MPTYRVITANLAMTQEQEAEIAAAITRAHHESTGAPAYFAQVFFSPIDKGRPTSQSRFTDASPASSRRRDEARCSRLARPPSQGR